MGETVSMIIQLKSIIHFGVNYTSLYNSRRMTLAVIVL